MASEQQQEERESPPLAAFSTIPILWSRSGTMCIMVYHRVFSAGETKRIHHQWGPSHILYPFKHLYFLCICYNIKDVSFGTSILCVLIAFSTILMNLLSSAEVKKFSVLLLVTGYDDSLYL